MSKRSGRRRLRQRLETTFAGKETEPIRFRAVQGNGEGVVKVAGKRNYVYVRRIGRSRIEECLNTRSPARDGLPVIVGYTHEMPDVLQVLEVDWAGMSGLGDYVYLAAHHKSHEFMNSSGGDDVVWAQKQQFLPFLVHPTGPSSMYVDVFGGWYQWDNGWHYFEAAVSADLSGNVPVGAPGEARFVLVSIDGATETLNYVSGDVFPMFLPLPDREDMIPSPPSGVIPVAAIYLPFGTTVIEWDNIYDVRLLFSGGGPMSVGAAPRDAAYVVLGLDPTLTAERVLVEGADAVITDGGAGGNVTVGRSGNKILRFDSDGAVLTEYAITHAGLVSALGATAAGDVIWLPQCEIALEAPITIPTGTTLTGLTQPGIEEVNRPWVGDPGSEQYPKLYSPAYDASTITLVGGAVLEGVQVYRHAGVLNGAGVECAVSVGVDCVVRRCNVRCLNNGTKCVAGIHLSGAAACAKDCVAKAEAGNDVSGNDSEGIRMSGAAAHVRDCTGAATSFTGTAVGIYGEGNGEILRCIGSGHIGLQIATGTVTSRFSYYSGVTVDLQVDAAATLNVYGNQYASQTINGILTHLAGDRAGTRRDETITGDWNLNTGEMGLPSGGAFPGVPQDADIFYRTDENKLYIYNGIEWLEIGGGAGGGGGGGGNPTFRCDGTLIVTTNVNEAYVVASSVEIVAVYIHCGTLGTASSTIVDVNKNGVTIFTNQANRPTLAWNDADGVAKSGTPDITGLAENDVVTVDTDQVATGARDLSVIIALAVTGSAGAGTIEIQEDDVKIADASILNFEGTGCAVTDDGGGKATVDIPGGWELISETVLTGSVSSLTFSSIPQTYRSLVLQCQARTDRASEADNIDMRFNGDTGNNYDWTQIYGRPNTITCAAGRATSYMHLVFAEGGNSRANNFAIGTIAILGYTLTDREKRAMCPTSGRMGDASADTDMYLATRQGRWRNTTAVTSLTIFPHTGPNFVSGCRFTLYGVL